jgi:hypothetical protein
MANKESKTENNLSKKMPEFTFENIVDFIIWLTEYYKHEYDAPSRAIDGRASDSISDAEWEAEKTQKWLDGFMGDSLHEYGGAKQIAAFFHQDIKDSETGGYVRHQDGNTIPSELFEMYLAERFGIVKK